MFINILKIRLSALGPRFGRDIVRNEAHVRLATSVWYASVALSLLGIMCLVLLGILLFFSHGTEQLKHYFTPVFFISAVVLLCAILKHQLRRCIHYMRVREVVYVLESTHLASQTSPEFGIDELIGKQGTWDCSHCHLIRVPDKPPAPEGGPRRGLDPFLSKGGCAGGRE